MTDQKKTKGRPAGALQVGRAEHLQIADLLAKGLTPGQIAKVIGRGRATVYNHVKKLRQEPPLPMGRGDA